MSYSPEESSSLTSRRVSRRRFVAGAAALGVGGALVAAGCSGRKTNPPPRAGGALRTATTVPIAEGLDPHIETGTGLRIFPRIYGYTHHVDPRDDSLMPDQAASVEQPDSTTIVLRLRDDVRFHDVPPVHGRAVTSSDVARSIERYRDNPLVTNKTWHIKVLDSVETPDLTTVVVRTNQPYAYSLQELGAIAGGSILPQELTATNADLTSIGAGSGPFTLEEGLGLNRVRIARFPDYYRSPVPYLDGMEWNVVDTDDARVDAFLAGEVEEISNRDRAENERIVREGDSVQASAVPALAYVSLGLRVDHPPFSDPRVREAVDMALDRSELIGDVLQGDGEILGPVNGHLSGGYWSLDPQAIADAQGAATPSDARRAAARAAIVQAGADVVPVLLQVADHPQLIDVATIVRDQLGRAGLDVRLDVLDQLSWYVNYRSGRFDATLISQPPYEWPDAPTRLYQSGGLDGTGSQFGFADPAIDWLVTRSWGETERDQRRQTLLEAQRLMIAARPMLQLFTTTSYATASHDVRNWRPELPGSIAQYNYEQWLDR